jgi:hypothetical protein
MTFKTPCMPNGLFLFALMPPDFNCLYKQIWFQLIHSINAVCELLITVRVGEHLDADAQKRNTSKS